MSDLTWDIQSSDVAPTQAAIQDIGARWVRLEFRWYEGQPSKGAFDAQTLEKWDRAVATSQDAGAKIVAMVHRAPGWASASDSTYAPPQDPADYAAFMRFLAERYRGKVAAWEIWNEPNNDRFWPSGPDPAAYVSLLKAGYGAVKAVDPASLVVFGGLSQNDYSFVEAAYDAGAKGHFDVMNVHPYPGPHAPEEWYLSDGRIAKGTFTGYREVRASMLARGDDKPIWLTEFGWSTTSTDAWGVTPAQQADFLTRAYCLLEQDPYVQVALWYNLRNNHWDQDADRWETQLGLLNTTFERKPSYDAYKAYGEGTCPTPSPLTALPPATGELLFAPPEPAAIEEAAAEQTDMMPPVGTQPATLKLRHARLSVRRAQVLNGELVLDGRVARGVAGTVRGVAAYGGFRHQFVTPIDSNGRLRVREQLPNGADTSMAWVALVYAGTQQVRGQWVVLQAAEHAPRLRVQREADTSSVGPSQTVQGSVVPGARGSVTLAVFYRSADGSMRTRSARGKIRRGSFRRSVKLPAGARDPILNVVYAGDPARGIGGSSRVLALD